MGSHGHPGGQGQTEVHRPRPHPWATKLVAVRVDAGLALSGHPWSLRPTARELGGSGPVGPHTGLAQQRSGGPGAAPPSPGPAGQPAARGGCWRPVRVGRCGSRGPVLQRQSPGHWRGRRTTHTHGLAPPGAWQGAAIRQMLLDPGLPPEPWVQGSAQRQSRLLSGSAGGWGRSGVGGAR